MVEALPHHCSGIRSIVDSEVLALLIPNKSSFFSLIRILRIFAIDLPRGVSSKPPNEPMVHDLSWKKIESICVVHGSGFA